MTPLVCAVRAPLALHQGDGARPVRSWVDALRLRGLLTCAVPYMAVQTRIELTRIYLALADLGGAWALLQEIGEVLRRRPGLGTLAGEAAALRARRPGGAGSQRHGVRRSLTP